MLIDYFWSNQRDPEARLHLYVDIPNFYTFHKEKSGSRFICSWKKRQNYFKFIGRMYSVNPSQIELYHLRLLLLTIRGATSFENLRTVNGQIYSTFTEACISLGLVADDHEWNRAMNEATIWMMPYHLRRLFVRILLNCFPLHPENLWHEFKFAMSEDYSKNMSSSEAQVKALQQIQNFLEEEGKNLRDFPTLPVISNINIELYDEIYFEHLLETGIQYYNKLNSDQQTIVDTILCSVTNSHMDVQTCFYIDGPGGSGKTFIYTCLWYLLMGRKIKVQTMAFTGIAATLLPQGKTVHKTFGLTVPLYPDSNSTIKLESKEAKSLMETKVFIWDEAPMAPRYALEAMDRNLRDIMNNNNPFGGKIVILGGDFRQLLPVHTHGTRNETINLSIKYSQLWELFLKFHLTINMRTLPDEIEFSELLLKIGNGILNDDEDNIQLPKSCIETTDMNIAEDIYGDLIKTEKYKEVSRCAILSARNVDVDEINEEVVKLLDITSERIYTSVDSTENYNSDEINSDLVPEYLNSLNPIGLPPHELKLRRFSIIMLIRNLNISEGLCNGTRLLVLDLANNILRCEILTGDKTGDIIILHRITLLCENIYPFTFSRRQFPIKLAFAITINKAQGQTFEKIGVDLRKNVFNHGQLYVALSRVRSWRSLKIYIGSQRLTTTVKNYVYKELLDNDDE